MALKKSKIKLAETGQFSKMFLDYIGGSATLHHFYSYEPQIESFQQAIDDKAKEPTNRLLLATVLKEQYAQISNQEFQKKT